MIGNAPIADQAFTNNRVVGQRMKVEVTNRAYRPQRLRISGNSSNTPGPPAAMNLYGVDGLTVSGNLVPMTGGPMAYISRLLRRQRVRQLLPRRVPGGSDRQSPSAC